MTTAKIETLEEYVHSAMRTAPMLLPEFESLGVFAMGLSGESGEVVDLLKKVVGHGHDLDKEKLIKELGDVMWYLAVLGRRFDFNVERPGWRTLDEINKNARQHEFEGSGNIKTIRLSLRLDAYAGRVSDAVDHRIAGFKNPEETLSIEDLLARCWCYVALIAHRYEISLSEVATRNYQKLLARYPNGFNSEDSKNRAVEA